MRSILRRIFNLYAAFEDFLVRITLFLFGRDFFISLDRRLSGLFRSTSTSPYGFNKFKSFIINFLIRFKLIEPNYVLGEWKVSLTYRFLIYNDSYLYRIPILRHLIFIKEAGMWMVYFFVSVLYPFLGSFRKYWFKWLDYPAYIGFLKSFYLLNFITRYFDISALIQMSELDAEITDQYNSSFLAYLPDFYDLVDSYTFFHLYYLFVLPISRIFSFAFKFFYRLRFYFESIVSKLTEIELIYVSKLEIFYTKFFFKFNYAFHGYVLYGFFSLHRLSRYLFYYAFTIKKRLYSSFRFFYLYIFSFKLFFPLNYPDETYYSSSRQFYKYIIYRIFLLFATIPVFFAFCYFFNIVSFDAVYLDGEMYVLSLYDKFEISSYYWLAKLNYFFPHFLPHHSFLLFIVIILSIFFIPFFDSNAELIRNEIFQSQEFNNRTKTILNLIGFDKFSSNVSGFIDFTSNQTVPHVSDYFHSLTELESDFYSSYLEDITPEYDPTSSVYFLQNIKSSSSFLPLYDFYSIASDSSYRDEFIDFEYDEDDRPYMFTDGFFSHFDELDGVEFPDQDTLTDDPAVEYELEKLYNEVLMADNQISFPLTSLESSYPSYRSPIPTDYEFSFDDLMADFVDDSDLTFHGYHLICIPYEDGTLSPTYHERYDYLIELRKLEKEKEQDEQEDEDDDFTNSFGSPSFDVFFPFMDDFDFEDEEVYDFYAGFADDDLDMPSYDPFLFEDVGDDFYSNYEEYPTRRQDENGDRQDSPMGVASRSHFNELTDSITHLNPIVDPFVIPLELDSRMAFDFLDQIQGNYFINDQLDMLIEEYTEGSQWVLDEIYYDNSSEFSYENYQLTYSPICTIKTRVKFDSHPFKPFTRYVNLSSIDFEYSSSQHYLNYDVIDWFDQLGYEEAYESGFFTMPVYDYDLGTTVEDDFDFTIEDVRQIMHVDTDEDEDYDLFDLYNFVVKDLSTSDSASSSENDGASSSYILSETSPFLFLSEYRTRSSYLESIYDIFCIVMGMILFYEAYSPVTWTFNNFLYDPETSHLITTLTPFGFVFWGLLFPTVVLYISASVYLYFDYRYTHRVFYDLNKRSWIPRVNLNFKFSINKLTDKPNASEFRRTVRPVLNFWSDTDPLLYYHSGFKFLSAKYISPYLAENEFYQELIAHFNNTNVYYDKDQDFNYETLIESLEYPFDDDIFDTFLDLQPDPYMENDPSELAHFAQFFSPPFTGSKLFGFSLSFTELIYLMPYIVHYEYVLTRYINHMDWVIWDRWRSYYVLMSRGFVSPMKDIDEGEVFNFMNFVTTKSQTSFNTYLASSILSSVNFNDGGKHLFRIYHKLLNKCLRRILHKKL